MHVPVCIRRGKKSTRSGMCRRLLCNSHDDRIFSSRYVRTTDFWSAFLLVYFHSSGKALSESAAWQIIHRFCVHGAGAAFHARPPCSAFTSGCICSQRNIHRTLHAEHKHKHKCKHVRTSVSSFRRFSVVIQRECVYGNGFNKNAVSSPVHRHIQAQRRQLRHELFKQWKWFSNFVIVFMEFRVSRNSYCFTFVFGAIHTDSQSYLALYVNLNHA